MTAPIANDFKDNVLTGSIDSGTVKMTKSEEESITMGNILANASNALKEYTDYDVYFFLSDGINDSTIKKVTVTTADRTPPEFLTNYPRISKIEAKKLTGEAAINEDGKVYWALVKRGTDYPVPDPNLDPNNPNDAEKLELYYKNQIKGGMYALKSGSVSTNEDAIKSISFSGLEAETAYDIYFVAEDEHGNLSEIKIITNAKTLDSSAPELLEQKFSLANDKGIPLADTDITLVFDEDIYSNENRKSLYEMFNEISSADDIVLTTTDNQKYSFEDLINRMFVLSDLNANPSDQTLTLDLGGTNFKNYINIKLTEDGYTEVTFKAAALPLKSGGTYQFTLNHIGDSSNNNMGENIKVEEFTILNAQIDVNKLAISTVPDKNVDDKYKVEDASGQKIDEVRADAPFSMIPYANSTASAADGISYDVLIASDTSISFEVYRRERKDSTGTNLTEWTKLKNKKGESEFKITNDTSKNKWTALSLNDAMGLGTNEYPPLKTTENSGFPQFGYEYAVSIRSINGDSNIETWNSTINMKIFCIAGLPNDINTLTPGDSVTDSAFDSAINATPATVSSIGNPAAGRDIVVECRPNTPPQFLARYPQANVGDSIIEINYMLDRDGIVYYAIAPVKDYENVIKYSNGTNTPPAEAVKVGAELDIGTAKSETLPAGVRNHMVTTPTANDVMNGFSGSSYISGSSTFTSGGVSKTIYEDGLRAKTEYYIFFVLRNEYVSELSPVMVYKFTTGDVVPPDLRAAAGTANASYYITPKVGQPSVTAETYWRAYTDVTTSYPVIFDYKIKFANIGEPQRVRDAMYDGNINTKTDNDVEQILSQDGTPLNITFSNLKDELYNIISATNSGSPAPIDYSQGPVILESTREPDGQIIETGSNLDIIDPEKIQEDTDYIVFIAAKNKLGGEPVFASVQGIRKYDTEGPRISTITTSTYHIDNDTINSSVTIEFDDYIYLRETGTSPPVTKPYQDFKDLGYKNDIIYTPLKDETVEITSVRARSITVLIKNSHKSVNFQIEPGQTGYDPAITSVIGTARGSISIRFELDKEGNPTAVINGGVYDGLISELDE